MFVLGWRSSLAFDSFRYGCDFLVFKVSAGAKWRRKPFNNKVKLQSENKRTFVIDLIVASVFRLRSHPAMRGGGSGAISQGR
jgi:hypothetical protein